LTDPLINPDTAAQRAKRRLCLAAKKVHDAAVWLFAPVATSVKGALDKTDWRPVASKVIALSASAGLGTWAAAKEAMKDPESASLVVMLVVAVISGFLEALTRKQAGEPKVEILLPVDAKNQPQPPAPGTPPAPSADQAATSSPTGPTP
jgi:hypothetical protein